MDWRPLAQNRFVVTLSAIVVVVILWNGYVSLHDGGSVRGHVVDASGKRVAGATVVLSRKTVASVDTIGEAVTDDDGVFFFRDHGQYALVLTASAEGVASARTVVPLWFRDQDVVLAEPIVLRP
jgi:hypothetical protein